MNKSDKFLKFKSEAPLKYKKQAANPIKPIISSTLLNIRDPALLFDLFFLTFPGLARHSYMP
jgi:hypothetical protein